jgi:hypothetical protein
MIEQYLSNTNENVIVRKILTSPRLNKALGDPSDSGHKSCVWLWDQWVGTAPTRVLGTAPTLPLFGCKSGFASLSVWLEDSMGLDPFHFLFGWMDLNQA